MMVETPHTKHGRAALGEATKRAILDAAARVFAAQGFSGARIDAIAVEAGVNKALLYYHFEGKEQLMAAVFERHLAEANGPMLEALRRVGSPCQALLDYVGLHFDAIAKGPRLASLHQQFMAADQVAEPLIFKYARPRALALGALLKRGIAAGEFRPVDPEQTVISITSLVVHYFSITPLLRRLGASDPTSLRQLALRRREVLAFVRHAIFAAP